MRVLVVGTLPPPGGEPARALADAANALRDEGHDVELFSPDHRSAAHRHARLEGPLLAAWLAYLSPRFDAVYLRFEPGFPLRPHASRAMRAASMLALGTALRRYGEVTVRFDGGPSIPLGLGGRAMQKVWEATKKIVVASEDKRDELIAASGLDPSAVTVSTARNQTRPRADEGWALADGDELRIGISARIRARADRTRAAERAFGGFVSDADAKSRSPLTGDIPAWTASGIFHEIVSATRVIGRRLFVSGS
ncbi:MAG: hypothetical protein WCF24_02665 [Acidimicrobiales bacterium]